MAQPIQNAPLKIRKIDQIASIVQTSPQEHTKKRYACNRCPKTYAQRYSLINHLRMHDNVRPYACKNCDCKFTNLSTLVKHQRTHTGEKPYALVFLCRECVSQIRVLNGCDIYSVLYYCTLITKL